MTPQKITGLTPTQIIGWKVNAIGVLSILLGVIGFVQGQHVEGTKGVMFGLALLTIRNVLGKVLGAIDSARMAMSDLRAAIEADLDKRKVVP